MRAVSLSLLILLGALLDLLDRPMLVDAFACVASSPLHHRQRRRGIFSSLSPAVLSDFCKVFITDVDGQERAVRLFDSHHSHKDAIKHRPMLVIGGTAQTISTFAPHLRHLSRDRRLLIPELRCQGHTELLCTGATVAQHVEDVELVLQALGLASPVDVVGFSFGGRVAIAAAAHKPHLVARLSVTGVPLVRPPLGQLIVRSWIEALPHDFRSAAWSFLLNGYSQRFIDAHYLRLPKFVELVMEGNNPEKLFCLMQGIHGPDDAYSVSACAPLVRCPTQVIGATEDRIAGMCEVRRLAEVISSSSLVEIAAGHLAPFEEPVLWRRRLMEHFDRHEDQR